MLIPTDSTLPLTKEVFSSAHKDPSKLFELMNLDLKAIAERHDVSFGLHYKKHCADDPSPYRSQGLSI